MQTSTVVYAVIQSVHNVGAGLVVGFAMVLALKIRKGANIRPLLWPLLIVWSLQGATGVSFALTSIYFHGAFPAIPFVAKAAMGIKVACTAVAFCISAWLLYKKATRAGTGTGLAYLALPVIALVAASVLRWFS